MWLLCKCFGQDEITHKLDSLVPAGIFERDEKANRPKGISFENKTASRCSFFFKFKSATYFTNDTPVFINVKKSEENFCFMNFSLYSYASNRTGKIVLDKVIAMHMTNQC